MKKRNWVELSTKLVDRFDLDETLQFIQTALGVEALSYWGFGVLETQDFPVPFPITPSGASMAVDVGPGVAYDPNGQVIRDPDLTNTVTLISHPSLPRRAIVVARFKFTGDTPVPKPSDPLTSIMLNLHDDYEIVVIHGTPAASPAYPAKDPADVILTGFLIPAAATLASACTEDPTARESTDLPASRVSLADAPLLTLPTTDLQSFAELMDNFQQAGVQVIASDNADHDRGSVVCNSGGVNGDTLTIAGVTFTIGAGVGQIPIQGSATLLGFAIVKAIRSNLTLNPVYACSAQNGQISILARAAGAVGGALAETGTSFTVSGVALAGNGARTILTSVGLAQQLSDIEFFLGTLMPPGAVIAYGGSAAPGGWLFCSGQVVSQATYANLFAALGTAYDTGGEGAGNFRLPDFRSRSIVGVGPGGGGLSARARGNSGGEETHTLSTPEIPSHAHQVVGNTSTNTTGISATGSNLTIDTDAGGNNQNSDTAFFSDPGHAHGINFASQNTGGGGAHNNMHPYGVANFIIKT